MTNLLLLGFLPSGSEGVKIFKDGVNEAKEEINKAKDDIEEPASKNK